MKKLYLIASFALVISVATVQPAAPTMSSLIVSMYTNTILKNPWASAAIGVTALVLSAAALSHKPYKVLVYKNHSVADKNSTESHSFRTRWAMNRYITAAFKKTPTPVQIQWSYKNLRGTESGSGTYTSDIETILKQVSTKPSDTTPLFELFFGKQPSTATTTNPAQKQSAESFFESFFKESGFVLPPIQTQGPISTHIETLADGTTKTTLSVSGKTKKS